MNILKFNQRIETLKRDKKIRSKGIITIFYDFQGAYDSLNHRILYRKLLKLGVEEEFVNTIKWLYGNTKI